MKVLVTGGNGFLGKHVQEAFAKTDLEVIYPSSHDCDLLDRHDVDVIIYKHKPDIIVHMAAICGGILANKNSPADFISKNTTMTLNIFDAILEWDVKYLYTLGTVCAYPKYCPVPFKEDDLWNGFPEETNAPYGTAKRHMLMMQQAYKDQYGLKGAHLIPVNMYGPMDHFDLTNSHVIPALIRKFKDAVDNNKPVVNCWGTGEATREFLYAGDCAAAIVKAVEHKLDYRDPINIGTGESISIKELAITIAKISGFNGDIVFNGEVSDGQPKRQLDVSRAKEVLGFEAKTKLFTGLMRTYCWYQDNQHLIKD